MLLKIPKFFNLSKSAVWSLINKLSLNQNQFLKYLKKNFTPKQKILISVSCGLDSTVLYNLIIKSQFFELKNIFCIFFDHQKRPEGKYEIEKFIKYYGLNKKNVFIKNWN